MAVAVTAVSTLHFIISLIEVEYVSLLVSFVPCACESYIGSFTSK